jgi:predicted lipase
MISILESTIKDDTLLRKAIDLSAGAYEDLESEPPVGTDSFCGENCDGYVVVRTDANRISIAFRGTESYVDWIINMTRYIKGCDFLSGTGGHAGTLDQYTELRTRILAFVDTSMHAGIRDILITGHSLGGALSTLCAADLATQFPMLQVVCYPLNSPRVGNRQFVHRIGQLSNLSITRVQTQHDIVSCLPYFGFVHTPVQAILTVSWQRHGIRFFHVRARHSMKTLQMVFGKL